MPALVFPIDSPEVKDLAGKDKKLRSLIDELGGYTLELEGDYFSGLVSSIISQQLSSKAAATIYSRAEKACGGYTPSSVINAEEASLRSCGLSTSKVSYLKDLAAHVSSGRINLEELNRLADHQVIEILTQVRGIGTWTAEMFLIFSLGRLDVFSTKDMGLRQAVRQLYSLENMPGLEEMNAYGLRWKPYRSLASLYLWQALDQRLFDKEGF